MISRGEAEKFLKAFDDKTDKFTFQTFDEEGKNKSLVRILHGTLAQHWNTLSDLNKKGAGVYVTVNETDFKGRKADNIKRVRYVFVDLDGAPLTPAKEPRPHIIVESSPKRWHVYWRVKNMPLEEFREAQRKQIKRLNSDKSITDLPRVLRLPGFVHQKGKPFRTKVVTIWDGQPYAAKKFISTEPMTPKQTKTNASNLPPVDIKEINSALEVLPSDDYQIWFEVGCALHKELGDEKGYPLFDRWSRKSEKYDKRKCEEKWNGCAEVKGYNAGTIFHHATVADPTWRELDAIPDGATAEDFVSFLPKHDYIYTPTGQHWPASSVNSQLPKQTVGTKRIKATNWLDRNRQVQAMTWSPGDPEMIPDRIAKAAGGWIEKPGTMCLNLYCPPTLKPGDGSRAMPWINHVHKLYSDEDAAHLINWFASKIQFPGVKVNHGLIIGGEQGIGKDMILKPVRNAAGVWNCVNVAPKDIMSSFNSHVKSVICQIDEARDLGDARSYDFYEHLKTLTTAPPDLLQCNEKYINPYAVMNVTGVVITTNHRTGSVYLPPGDRRFYVAWSTRHREEFSASYFTDLEAFYNNGGYGHVCAYLRSHVLKGFNPKAAPKQTEAWHDIVEAWLPVEDSEFSSALDNLGRPSAVTIRQIWKEGTLEFQRWLEERKNARQFAHRLESCGYVAVRNPKNGHNRWRYKNKVGTGKEVAVFAQASLSNPVRIKAAEELVLKLREVEGH